MQLGDGSGRGVEAGWRGKKTSGVWTNHETILECQSRAFVFGGACGRSLRKPFRRYAVLSIHFLRWC